jgi:hypothetical protein
LALVIAAVALAVAGAWLAWIWPGDVGRVIAAARWWAGG